jgi:tetratricopeptide (TPR) repeat protein
VSAPVPNIAQWANEGAPAAPSGKALAVSESQPRASAGQPLQNEERATNVTAPAPAARSTSEQALKQERENRARAEEIARQAAEHAAREKEARLKAEADLRRLKDEVATAAREAARAEAERVMRERDNGATLKQQVPSSNPPVPQPPSTSQAPVLVTQRATNDVETQAVKAKSDAQEALKRGMALGQRGDLDGAITEFNTAIRLNPSDPSVYLERATVLTLKKDADHALADLNEVLRLDPKNARARNNRGIQYREKGDLDQAIADFGEAIQSDPGYTRAYYNRGTALAAKGDLDAAIRDFDAALRIDPTVSGGYADRGEAYLHKGDHKRATADFDAAIRLDPDDLDAYNGRAYAYAAQGDLDRAIADFGIVIQKAPNVWTAYLNRGSAYTHKGQIDLAIKDLNEAARLNPQEPSVFLNRGVALKKKGELGRAIADYTAAIRLDPKDAAAYSNRGVAYQQTGNRQEALKDFETALAIDPTLQAAREGREKAKGSTSQQENRKWTYLKEGRTVIFGVPETDDVQLRLICTGQGKSQVEIPYAGKASNSLTDGQAFALSIIKAGTSLRLSGKINRATFGDEFVGWDFVTDLPSNHAIFDLIKTGGSLVVAQEAQLSVPLTGAQKFIDEWQRDCELETDTSNLVSSTSIKSQEKVPVFGDYPVRSVYQGNNVPPILDDPRKRNYRTRIREARNAKPNLAGRYILTVWGCGSGCNTGAVVDATTGKVIMLPFALATAFVGDEEAIGPDFYLRPNSALIVFAGKFESEDDTWQDPSGGRGGYHYFVFDGTRFRYLTTSLTNIE